MPIWSYIISAVLAAESAIVPVSFGSLIQRISPPSTSFGQLASRPTPTRQKPRVLGEQTESNPTDKQSANPLPARKARYTIALLGDSMIDTLGPDVGYLKKILQDRYPGTSFTLLNYGAGGTNIDYGIERITSDYEYLGHQVVALAATHPDIVVIESFGYNPFPDSGNTLDRHWLALAKAVDTVRSRIPGAKIVIAATIAPNSDVFGDGAPGIAFSPEDKKSRTDVIKSYLDSTVKFAKSQNLPLADAYHPSLDSNGDGKTAYINAGDHIHYSSSGRALFSQKIADAISAHSLL